MIHWLKGEVIKLTPEGVILEVGGIGYGVEVPVSSLIRLRENQKNVELHIFTHVREDCLRLFGFKSALDRQMFALLISISGVGPKVALAIMSTLNIGEIIDAATYEQTALLERVPGIGKRTAERILLELKTKVEKFSKSIEADSDTSSPLIGALSKDSKAANQQLQSRQDAHSGLVNLGFKPKDIEKALGKIMESEAEFEFQELMTRALIVLTGRKETERKLPKGGLNSTLF